MVVFTDYWLTGVAAVWKIVAGYHVIIISFVQFRKNMVCNGDISISNFELLKILKSNIVK